MRPAGGRGRVQHRPRRVDPRRPRHTRRHRQPLLLVEPADDPHGGARDQGRGGRLLHLRRRRGRQPLRLRRFRHRTQRSLQAGRRAHARAAASRGTGLVAGRGPARHLHRDGPDRRERRPERGRHATGDGRVRGALAAARRGQCRQRFLGARDLAVDAARRHGGHEGRRAAARHHRRRAQPAQAGVPPRRPGHGRQRLPAQRRRRGRARHERHEGRTNSASRRSPASCRRASRRSTRRSWAWARSKPAVRR